MPLTTLEKFASCNLPEADEESLRLAVDAINSGEVKIIGFSGKKGAGKDTYAEAFRDILAGEGKETDISPFAGALKGELTAMILQMDAFLNHPRSLTEHATHLLGLDREKQQEEERVFLQNFSAGCNVSLEQAAHLLDIFREDILKRNKLKPVFDGWTRSAAVWNGLAYLGTDVRQPQDKLYWVRRTVQKIAVNAVHGKSTIVSDVRFLHEADALKSIGGYLLRVEVSPEVRMKRLAKRDNLSATDVAAAQHASETQLDGYTGFDHIIDNNEGDLQEKIKQAYSVYRDNTKEGTLF